MSKSKENNNMKKANTNFSESYTGSITAQQIASGAITAKKLEMRIINKEDNCEIGKNGKVDFSIIKSKPVMALENSDTKGGFYKFLYLKDLLDSKVGDKFCDANKEEYSYRNLCRDSVTVIFKNNYGVLCYKVTERTTDEDMPVMLDSEEKFIWVSFEN